MSESPFENARSFHIYGMESTCKQCGKPLIGRRKFCDMACYTTYKKQNQVSLICDYCGSKFCVSPQRAQSVRHCSRRCYIQAANEAGQRICKDCKQLKAITEFNTHSPAKNLHRRYCIECEKRRVKIRCKRPKERWMAAKRRAARSGETWDISLEVFEALLSQPCHYCGGQLNPTGCGLDRRDNIIGYIESNVMPCCKQCNVVKNCFFSYEEMMMLSPTLIEIRSNRANGK